MYACIIPKTKVAEEYLCQEEMSSMAQGLVRQVLEDHGVDILDMIVDIEACTTKRPDKVAADLGVRPDAIIWGHTTDELDFMEIFSDIVNRWNASELGKHVWLEFWDGLFIHWMVSRPPGHPMRSRKQTQGA